MHSNHFRHLLYFYFDLSCQIELVYYSFQCHMMTLLEPFVPGEQKVQNKGMYLK